MGKTFLLTTLVAAFTIGMVGAIKATRMEKMIGNHSDILKNPQNISL
jgi:hypothetical protein